MTLHSLGWDDHFETSFQPFHTDGFVPARVVLEHRHAYHLLSADGELTAECTGRMLHESCGRGDLPAVGDWVVARPRPGDNRGSCQAAAIHAVLPRRTKFSRRAAGDSGAEQILAANIDTAFLVTALDQNFNLRRIERYLTATRESGATPVIVLNKADLHSDPASACAEVSAVAGGAAVVALSAACGDGLDALTPWLAPARTLALLGSSGVGKSTLINRLLGTDRMATGAISEAVGKGRHTTTHRELIVTPSGALVIDTPGMRELQLWSANADDIDGTFTGIVELAARCRFSDCTHHSEPGCAILAALDDGSLDAGSWESYLKLQREQAYAARKASPKLASECRHEWKKLHKAARAKTWLKQHQEE
jgi:ribosome biogenesis GTPase